MTSTATILNVRPQDRKRVLAAHAKLPGQSLETTVSNLAHHGLIDLRREIPIADYRNAYEATRAALERAVSEGYGIGKHADPTEDARFGLDVDEAAEIASEDQSLIYIAR
jgi:hypothetical protein